MLAERLNIDVPRALLQRVVATLECGAERLGRTGAHEDSPCADPVAGVRHDMWFVATEARHALAQNDARLRHAWKGWLLHVFGRR